MKNILKLTPLLIILFLVARYNENITKFVIENFVYYNKNTEIINNEYALKYNYLYISSVTDFSVTDKKDLLNTLYIILNSGEEEFSFYCDYEACTSDLNTLINTNSLSTINNFVHPYNSYKKVYVTINSYNKVTISFIKTYSNDDIKNIETKIDEITNNIITNEMSNKEKIIAFHNYIIDNARYDSDYINNNLNDINSPSHTAIGILFNGKALCGGYADVMSIFLNRLNIPNFLVASEYHVWNAVYLDNNWYHLDLTWDDPVTNDKKDIRLDKFLLISDSTLTSFNTGFHEFDRNIYLEFN